MNLNFEFNCGRDSTRFVLLSLAQCRKNNHRDKKASWTHISTNLFLSLKDLRSQRLNYKELITIGIHSNMIFILKYIKIIFI